MKQKYLANHTARVFALILAAASLTAAQTSVPSTAPAVELPQTAIDQVHYFQLRFPADWVWSHEGPIGAVLLHPPFSENQKSPTMMVRASPLSDWRGVQTQADLDRIYRQSIQRYATIIDQRTVSIDGAQASEIIFTSDHPYPHATCVDIGLVRDGMVYSVTYNGTPEQMEKYLPAFNAIAASVHILSKSQRLSYRDRFPFMFANWTTQPAVALPHVATEKKYHFQISVPDGWEQDSTADAGTVSIFPVLADKKESTPELSATAYPLTDLPDVHTQEEFDARDRALVKRAGQIIVERTFLMGGDQANERIFISNYPSPDTITAEMGFIRDGMVYCVSWSGNPAHMQRYWREFNAIARSFHVVKQ